MTLSEELKWRGFINQTTLSDIKVLDNKKQPVFYHGYDASADSQTVGNLAAMMLDRCFLRHGYNAIILAGGATSLIGDPGGKDAERELQTPATVARNVKAAEKQVKKVFSGYKFTMVNNLDWTKSLTVLSFLRDIGKHFSMTPLIQRDYIAKRLGESGPGISYAEFSYTLLQGMDYLYLYDKYNCTLQLGGADQWGNCLSGVDLIRRARGINVNAITLPLVVNKSTGKKFGKSEDGAIWLDPAKTSPTEFYQFWINTEDQRVEDYLKIFTELDKTTVESTMRQHSAEPAARIAQARLAEAVTVLVHGKTETENSKKVTDYLTNQKPIDKASWSDMRLIRSEISDIRTSQTDTITDVLVKAGLATSKSQARTFLSDGSVYINNEVVKRDNFTPQDFKGGRLLLRRGKVLKNTALVENS
ncbi:MAG TPA: tyrosine--tRNA ligase [Patescibacteria group bacterium]|jgi:tyrosyl-tRNA synthetase|nr:tyrosine--tRNA ligase [Patescibacteria group bacterium]